MDILISIIVPVYKVEDYIEKCIKSIADQTYSNIEIILVDDGSPDKCGDICDIWAKQDKRIQVIHKRNGGLSEARNYGIEISKGDYIMFVDSDDYIAPTMCEVLLKYIRKYNAEIVFCNFYWVYLNSPLRLNRMSIMEDECLLTGMETIKNYLTNYSVDLNVVWNKIYARKLFFDAEKLRFSVGKIHEDNFIIYRLYYKAGTIIKINNALYYYIQRNGSIMANISKKHLRDEIYCIKELYEFTKSKMPELLSAVQINSINDFTFKMREALKKRELCFWLMKYYKNVILSNTKNFKNNSYLSIKNLIKYYFIKFDVWFFLVKCKLFYIKSFKKNYVKKYNNLK